MILRREGLVNAARQAPLEPQPLECLRGGHLVKQVKVNVQEVRLSAFALADYVVLPNLFRESSRHVSDSSIVVSPRRSFA